MKILHICSNYLFTPLYDQLISEFEKVDNEIFVAWQPLMKQVITPRNSVHKVECFQKKDRFNFYLKSRKIEQALQKEFDINKFDCVHAHTLFTDGIQAMKIYDKHKIPYIVAVRNTDINVFFKYMPHLRKVGLEILEKASKIVFLSETYKRTVFEKYIPADLTESLMSKTCIIPNGVGNFWIKNKNHSKEKIKDNKIKIVYAGVINFNKNLVGTVKALKILRKKGFEVQYHIAGKIQNTFLFRVVQKNDFVTYHGALQKEMLLKLYKDCDIFVMPSKKETFGLVYAESMTQGVPVVYTQGQGFDKQFPDGKIGYSVDSRDSKDIAEKILRIYNNYEALSQNCIDLAEHFSWSDISKIYLNVYNQIL